MWIVEHNGQTYDLPFDYNPPDSMAGKFPNAVMLRIDDRDFDRRFGRHAIWVTGEGPYALLAYCKELTITRHKTLDAATAAKRPIDGGGCGGGCVKVHVIAFCDPETVL